MKDFDQLKQNIFEAKISQNQIDAYIAAFKKVVIAMEKHLEKHKDAGFDKVQMLELNTMIKYAKENIKPKFALDRLKNYGTPEDAPIKLKRFKKRIAAFIDEKKAIGDEKKAIETIKKLKPLTICDVLKYPNSSVFTLLMASVGDRGGAGREWQAAEACNKYFNMKVYDAWDTVSWFGRLEQYREDFKEWFEQQGGSKRYSVNAIRIAHACKDRADWTKFKGLAYRGVGRSLDRIKRYDYTGGMIKIMGRNYLVSTVKYKSKYGVQSWTPSLASALDFSEGGDIHTVLKTELGDDSFLTPTLIDKISEYPGEVEVLRVSDSVKTVTAYVNLKDIKEAYEESRGRIHDDKDTKLTYILKWTTNMFGAAAAKKLMNNKTYIKIMSSK